LALANVIPAWAAALVVGAVLLAVAGVLALLGRRQIKHATPPVPQQTADSLRADVEEIKGRARK
jgi:Putative Actinobacterial Holin-X, holin superfamily III